MKKVCLLITAMLCVLVYFVTLQTEKKQLPLHVTIQNGTAQEKISVWESDQDVYYFFLPSYAAMSNVTLVAETSDEILLDGAVLGSGVNCSDIQVGIPYTISYIDNWERHEKTIQFVQSANVPAMFIETESGTMDYIHAKKGNEEAGSMELYTADGKKAFSGAIATLNGRGNSTWDDFEKKPYSIQLSEPSDLLGLGSAQNWILLANADDASHMKNKIIFTLANEVGLAFTPDTEWVDLYLNGQYVGLYLLSERNEMHPERVDLAQEGGLLLSMEKADRAQEQSYSYLTTQESGTIMRIHDPQSPSTEEMEQYQKIWNDVEAAICDPEDTSWEEKIDTESWVLKYLIEEISANCDAGAISQFFYYSARDGKVYAGPVWDYDHSLGVDTIWAFQHNNMFIADRLNVNGSFTTPWFHQLRQKEQFFHQMKEMYEKELLPAIDQIVHEEIDQYTQYIAHAADMNQIRWSIAKTAQAKAEEIKAYIEGRIALLSDAWINNVTYNQVQAQNEVGNFWGYYAVPTGEYLTDLPVLNDTANQIFLGWYYVETNEPFDTTKPITEDISIYAKWQDKPNRLLGQIGKMIPTGIIAMMFLALLVADVRRVKKGG